jgi:hypothetical protein
MSDRLRVLSSANLVADHAFYVHVDEDRLAAVCDDVAASGVEVPPWNRDLHWTGTPEQTAMYVLILDSLNFCFWGEPRWTIRYKGQTLDGYWALAASLRRAIEEGTPLLDPAYLGHMPEADLVHVLRGRGMIPLFADRLFRLYELGRLLVDRYEGSAAAFIQAAEGDAVSLVLQLASDLSSFNDVASYQGREVCFFKRAQILVADLAGSLDGQGLGEFRNLWELTAFADYKLPQILRRFGILVYDPVLAERVDARELIAAGSEEEIEIRALTIRAVELLRQELERRGQSFFACQLDWWLWERSQHLPPDAKPYHRTRTVFY